MLRVKVVLLLLFLPVFAQDTDELVDMSLDELLNMEVVSATRSESKLSESPVPMSVITDKEIADSGLDNIPDILSRLVEIDVLRIGRSQSEVSIRGKGINFNRRLLVLIDGRTEYNDLFGVTLWHAFPISVDNIKRIEVVRGPASALFGANAYSGVINIITKQADDDPDNRVRAHFGEDGTEYATVSAGKQWKNFAIRASYNHQGGDSHETDVFFSGFNGIPSTVNFNLGDEESLDGMERFNIQAVADFSDKVQARFSGGFSDGKMELFQQPGLPRSDWDVQTDNLHFTLNYFQSDSNSLQINAYMNKFEYETPLVPTRAEQEALAGPESNGFFFPIRNSEALFAGEAETFDISLQYVGKTAEGKFNYVLGGEYRDISNKGNRGLVTESEKDITSLFGNFTYRVGEDWILGLGLRADDDSVTDTDYGYNVSAQYAFNSHDNIRLTVRRAFRAPSLFELFTSIDLPVPNQNQQVNFRGNTGLEVETINSIDLTYTVQLGGKVQATVEAFHEEYESIIGNPDSGVLGDVEITPEGLFISTTSFQNLADAEQNGFQATGVWLASEKSKIYGGFRYADVKDLNSVAGETFFTPETTFKLGGTFQVGKGFVVDTHLQYIGKTAEDEFTRGDIAPNGPNFTRDNQESYTLATMALHYRPPSVKGLDIYLVGDNLFDDNHVEYYEFDQILKGVGEELGRTIWGGISWDF